MVKGLFQFETAAADVLEIRAEKTNVGRGIHAGSGLFYFLSVYQDLASKDQGLSSLSRARQAPFQHQFV
jgi:hypothetical protein